MLLARAFSFAALAIIVPMQFGWAEKIGPSFDCNAARAPLGQMLCADPELSNLDLRFAQAYWALLRQVGDAGRQALKQEDVRFIGSVQQQCGIPLSGPMPPQTDASRNCVKNAYEKQRTVWLSRLVPPASEEANRPIEKHIALQRRLQELGLIPATTAIDGVYGAGTRTAIGEWQRSHNRTATGVLGNTEAQSLEQQVAERGSNATPDATGPNSSSQRIDPDTSVNSDEAYRKAQEAWERHDSNNALKWQRKAAEQGHIGAATELGKLYFSGCETCGVARDRKAALPWLLKAAVKNDRDAMFWLAGVYLAPGYEGVGNRQLGCAWLAKSMGAGGPISPPGKLQDQLSQAEAVDCSAQVRIERRIAQIKYLNFNPWCACQGALQSDSTTVYMSLAPNDMQIFSDDDLISEFLARVWGEVVQKCGGNAFTCRDNRSIEVGGGGFRIVAYWEKNQTWRINENPIKINIVQQQDKERVTKIKQQVRSEFLTKFNIQNFVNEKSLTTNPFVYKSQIVGVHTAFGRMISEREALFYWDGVGRNSLIVTDVPATQFTEQNPMVLAIKVLGTKAMKTPGGEATLPYGEYVGVFLCKDRGCSEFYDN